MQRYFLEVAYKGTNFSGFQVQENANTVQAEIEKAFLILHKTPIILTGSSRTDAGVHALQNFFHFDYEGNIHPQFLYKVNAILPGDIVVKNLIPVSSDSHSRFDAIQRVYEYRLYNEKNPFLEGLALYYPYKVDFDLLNITASIIADETNFYAFCKTNTQVNNFICNIYKSEWLREDHMYIYKISGNRFLRGMVRLLTATQLRVARGTMKLEEFRSLFSVDVNRKSGFSIGPTGLFLCQVVYPEGYFYK